MIKIREEAYQVVRLKNNIRASKLSISFCDSGTSAYIHKSRRDLIDGYSALSRIQMIISNTTAVNVGGERCCSQISENISKPGIE